MAQSSRFVPTRFPTFLSVLRHFCRVISKIVMADLPFPKHAGSDVITGLDHTVGAWSPAFVCPLSSLLDERRPLWRRSYRGRL